MLGLLQICLLLPHHKVLIALCGMVTYGQGATHCQCRLGFGKHTNSPCICVVIIFQFSVIQVIYEHFSEAGTGREQPLGKCGYRPWCLLVKNMRDSYKHTDSSSGHSQGYYPDVPLLFPIDVVLRLWTLLSFL